MIPMARAELAAVLLVFVVGSYLFRNYGRWRTAKDIQREIDTLPPLDYSRMRQRDPRVRLATLPEAKECEMRRLARVEAEARAAQQNERRLKLVITGSSRIH